MEIQAREEIQLSFDALKKWQQFMRTSGVWLRDGDLDTRLDALESQIGPWLVNVSDRTLRLELNPPLWSEYSQILATLRISSIFDRSTRFSNHSARAFQTFLFAWPSGVFRPPLRRAPIALIPPLFSQRR
jgi:hypothetical protein